MKNSFSIFVKSPCAEKFDNFEPTAKGGFCGSCEKEVIDFTTMPEKELINYFNNSSAKTCGRFRASQLKEYNVNTISTMNNNFLSRSIGTLSFSLLALCAVSNMQAQDVASAATPIQTEVSLSPNFETVNGIVVENYTVTGTVLDEDNLPLPGVNVILKGTAEGTVTDMDGKFEFPSTLEVDDILIFSYIGYITKEYTIPASQSDTLDITIMFDASDIELMGKIVVGGAYKSKRNIFQKIKGLFK
ncbi:MAG: hypothetical protein COA50_12665 [Flavobacteriaceae bacterium]|nr:MAG: hypothetical protein COA50_12665 [Flavobacteriaceae bacterium]